jgi:hypothetical protein
VALRRLSTSSIQTNGKSSKLWDQTTFQSGMFALATVSLTSSAASVTFSNIPQDYKHLQVRAIVRNLRASTWVDTLWLYCNSDTTGSNYNSHGMLGNGTSATSFYDAGQNSYGMPIGLTGATNSSFAYAPNIIDILDYTSTTKNKTLKNLHGLDDANDNGSIRLRSGLWINNSSPITSLTFTSGSADVFATYSHFALYGIKAG